jgi:hypothetical protein
MYLGFSITDNLGHRLFATKMTQHGKTIVNEGDVYTVRAEIPNLMLTPGSYSITLFLGNYDKDYDVIDRAVDFEVVWDADTSGRHRPSSHWGRLYFPVTWKTFTTRRGTER